MTNTSRKLTKTLKQVQETREYDCVNFTPPHAHETAVVEFDARQVHVTIYDATGHIVNMWNDDTTDASDVVDGLESMYLRISRIWD